MRFTGVLRSLGRHYGFLAFVLVFVLGMVASTSYTILRLQREAVHFHLQHAVELTHGFEDHLTQNLNLLDLTLTHAIRPDALPADSRQASEYLRTILRHMPWLRSISLADESGRLVLSSEPRNIGVRVDTADFLPKLGDEREFLRIGEAYAGRDFFDGQKQAGRPENDAGFIPLVKRISLQNKKRHLLVALNSDYFINYYTLRLESGKACVEVLRYDGKRLLSTQPEEGRCQRKRAFLEKIAEQEQGSFEDEASGAAPALTAFRASRLFPLVVVTDLDREQALAQWRSETRQMLFFVVPVVVLIVFLSLLLFLWQQRVAQQMAEAGRIEQERLTATVFDTLVEAIFLTDPENRIISVNPAFTRMTGYSLEEVKGRDPRLLSSQTQPRSFFLDFWKQLNSQGVWQGEVINRRKNGELMANWLSVGEVRDGSGKLTHRVAVLADISEKKKFDEQLKLASYSTELSSDAVFWVCSDGSLARFNPATCRMLGYSDEALSACSFGDIAPSYADERWPESWRTFREQGSVRVDVEYRRQNGQTIPVDMTADLLALESHEFLYVVARDLSEQKKMQLALEQARQQADMANRAKSRFLATMSHELRTPMNGVLGMAQLLKRPDLSDEERQVAVKTILDSGQLLMHLLNDILDLSKIEAGKMELRSEPFSPRSLVEEVLGLFSARAKEKKLLLAMGEMASGIYSGDVLRLRQMLGNLVSNALKFTPAGQVAVAVAWQPEDSAKTGKLRFVVTDSGPGIPPEQQGKLFQAFSQIADAGAENQGGTGLGLSIVSSFSRLMGGEAGCESDGKNGASFWFTVRVECIEAQDLVEPQPVETPSVGLEIIPEAPIWVVDDVKVNRMVAEKLLKQLGCSTRSFNDGQEVVDAIRADEPCALILMDCQMPGMDGFEATRLIREEENQRHPILALSAGVYGEERERCFSAGMDDFLAKPLMLHELVQMLNRHLVSEMPQALSAGDEDLPVLDRGGMSAVLGDVSDVRVILLATAPQVSGDRQALSHALEKDDWVMLGRLLHRMKGYLALVAARQSEFLCQKMEKALKAGDCEAIRMQWPALDEALQRLMDEIGRQTGV